MHGHFSIIGGRARAVSPKSTPMPPVSDFHLFPKNFQAPWTFFPILPFPNKICWFTKISDDLLLVIDSEFKISPIFSLNISLHFPLFRKNYYFPLTFGKFPPDFVKFTCFPILLRVFRFSPTLSMMHLCITDDHTMHAYWMPMNIRGLI